jgi:hypothetical protein
MYAFAGLPNLRAGFARPLRQSAWHSCINWCPRLDFSSFWRSAVAHPRAAHRDRTDAGHDLALRQMPVAHQPLLRPRHKWPHRRASNFRDELPPSQALPSGSAVEKAYFGLGRRTRARRSSWPVNEVEKSARIPGFWGCADMPSTASAATSTRSRLHFVHCLKYRKSGGG